MKNHKVFTHFKHAVPTGQSRNAGRATGQIILHGPERHLSLPQIYVLT